MVKESSTNVSSTGYQLLKPKSVKPFTEAVSFFLEAKVEVAQYQKRPHRNQNRFKVSPQLVQWLTLRSIHIDYINCWQGQFQQLESRRYKTGCTSLLAVNFFSHENSKSFPSPLAAEEPFESLRKVPVIFAFMFLKPGFLYADYVTLLQHWI